MAWVDREQLGQTAFIGIVDADPTVAGLVAPVGSFAILNTGINAWRKAAAANDAWANMSGMHLAAVPPVLADDVAAGFAIGDYWLDTATLRVYQAFAVGAGAAVWSNIMPITAAVPPTVADDDTELLYPGQVWLDTVTGISYTMFSNGTGAAEWPESTGMHVAAVAPGVNDDDIHGYRVGFLWYDTALGIGHTCTTSTTGAAAWEPVSAGEASNFALNGKFRAVYNFATDGGIVGANPFGPFLPDNAWVTEAFYEIITTFHSPTGPDNATVALGHADEAAGLVVAAAISVGTAFDATGVVIATLADGVIANFPAKTTAAQQLALTIGGEDIDAGRMVVFGTYATTE